MKQTKTTRATLWSGVENGGLAVLSFFTLILLSRFLTPAEFGLFSIVVSLIELLGLFVSMMFHDALVQRKVVNDTHFNTAFSVSLFLSVGLFIATCLLAPTFGRMMGDQNAAYMVVWCALTFPISAVSATIVPRYRRDLEFREIAIRSLVGRVTGAVLAIVLLFLGAGVWALVAQQICISLVGSLLLWFRTDKRPQLSFDKTAFQELFRFGSYSLAGLFVGFAARRLFIIASGVLLGSEASGYLNLSFRVVDMLWIVAATAVTQVVFPMLSRLQDDPERLSRAFRRANELQGFLLFPCFVAIAVLSSEIVTVFFGVQWLPAAPYITILGLLTLVQSMRLISVPMLKASGKPGSILIINIFELLIIAVPLIVMTSLTLPQAMTIWVVREVFGSLMTAWLLQRTAGISMLKQVSASAIPLLLVCVMGALMIYVGRWVSVDHSPLVTMAVLLVFLGLTYITSVGLVIFRKDQILSSLSPRLTAMLPWGGKWRQ